jgi:hypothetical protein
MGMHFGVIAIEGSAEELLAALGSAGSFTAGAPIDSFDDAPEKDAAGERTLIAGDHLGRAYLLDESLILSTDPDLIVDASRRLGRRVLAAVAETTSGAYILIAATDGRLERLHWLGLGQHTEPYDVGVPLAGEPPDGLDDLDGQRLLAVVRAAGFDVDGWRESGRKVIVEVDYAEVVAAAEAAAAAPAGRASAALGAFLTAHLVPGGDRIKPIVVRRENGGFDLAAPGSRLPDGTRVGQTGEGKPGLLGRLFGRR